MTPSRATIWTFAPPCGFGGQACFGLRGLLTAPCWCGVGHRGRHVLCQLLHHACQRCDLRCEPLDIVLSGLFRAHFRGRSVLSGLFRALMQGRPVVSGLFRAFFGGRPVRPFALRGTFRPRRGCFGGGHPSLGRCPLLVSATCSAHLLGFKRRGQVPLEGDGCNRCGLCYQLHLPVRQGTSLRGRCVQVG